MKIGILGGSFNPAHRGHLHISLAALQLLALDEIWWLITPRNPLKAANELLDLEQRLATAQEITKQHKIKVSSIEDPKNTNYSINLINELQQNYPEHKFIWLIGEDNGCNFDKWYKWQEIVETINIAIFPRNNLAEKFKQSPFYKHYGNYQLDREPALLIEKKPPYWCYLNIPEIDISATELRKKHGTNS